MMIMMTMMMVVVVIMVMMMVVLVVVMMMVLVMMVFQLLLDNNVDVGIRDNDGMSALMWCCHGDHLPHLRLLLNHVHVQYADDWLSDHDVTGRTWLHWSVRRTQPLHCLQVRIYSTCAYYQKSLGAL